MSDPFDGLPTAERDQALGNFMDAWSTLEASLRHLLAALADASDGVMFSIGAAIPDLGRMKDLLLALGAQRLGAEDQKELKDICQYLATSGQIRNSIVHGQWHLSYFHNGESTDDPIWVRVYTIADVQKLMSAVTGDDAELARKYAFPIDRLNERALKARLFAARIGDFSRRINIRKRQTQSSP